MTNYEAKIRAILDGLSVVVETDGRKVVLGKDEAVSALGQLIVEARVEELKMLLPDSGASYAIDECDGKWLSYIGDRLDKLTTELTQGHK